MPQALPRRIKLAFITQALTGSVVVSIGILLAGLLIRHGVLYQHMQREADLYWAGRNADPSYPLPMTSAMSGFVVDAGGAPASLPADLTGMAPGLHRSRERGQMVFVDARPQGTFYLTLSTGHIDMAILLTGAASWLLSLLTLYLLTWMTYRTSKRLVTPVSWLAAVVREWDPRNPDIAMITPVNLPADSGTEVRRLSRALIGLADRVGEFVQRERNFTRDASHELRTPLTVIRVATDLMQADPDVGARTQRSLARIQRASHDMEAVIEAFLILAREAEVATQLEELDVRLIIEQELERVRPLLAEKQVELVVADEGVPRLEAPPHVLNVMLGNLLRNAAQFTELGHIEVNVNPSRIQIRDSGIGMSPDTLARAFDPFYRADIGRDGKGMGLSIVRRLGDRFGWPVDLYSVPGEGTVATIHFSHESRANDRRGRSGDLSTDR